MNFNETSNILTEIFLDDALERAEVLDQFFRQTGKLVGPLHGVPIAVSDEIQIAGVGKELIHI